MNIDFVLRKVTIAMCKPKRSVVSLAINVARIGRKLVTPVRTTRSMAYGKVGRIMRLATKAKREILPKL